MLAIYVLEKIDTSKPKRALIVIGDEEVSASSVGIPIVKYKTVVTAISLFVTSIGGVVYTQL